MSYTRAELLAEKERRKKLSSSGFTREELLAEKRRREKNSIEQPLFEAREKASRVLGNIGSDIGEGLSNIYPNLIEGIGALPEMSKSAISAPERLPKNILAALGELGSGILNTPGNIRDYAVSRDLASEESPSFRLPESVVPRDYDYGRGVGLEETTPGDLLTRGLLKSIPYGIAGELGALGTAGRIGARAGSQGLMAIGENENPITAAGSVPALELPLRGVAQAGRLGRNLKPSNMLRGHLPLEELEKNLRATKGTNTALGDVLQLPWLKKAYENFAQEVPFSGTEEAFVKTKGQVEKAGESLMSKLGNNIKQADPNELVKSLLISQFEKERAAKTKLYNKAEQTAADLGINFDTPRFTEMANNYREILESDPILKLIPGMESTLRDLRKVKEKPEGVLGENALPFEEVNHPALSSIKLMAANLHETGKKYAKSSNPVDRQKAKIYYELAKAAREDVKDSIKNSGSDKLNKQFKEAESKYKENFAPFLHKHVYPLLDESDTAEGIARKIIRPSRNVDNSDLIKRIQKILPPDQKNTLGYTFLKTAEDQYGNIDPKKLASLTRSLGNKQFKALFPLEETRQAIQDFGKLRGLNEEALNIMHNPKTGYRNAKSLMTMIAAAVGGSLEPITTFSTIGATVGGARLLTKAVTSEKFRESLVKAMKENDKKSKVTPDKLNKLLKTTPYQLAAINSQEENE
jgi:hypothetical protein